MGPHTGPGHSARGCKWVPTAAPLPANWLCPTKLWSRGPAWATKALTPAQTQPDLKEGHHGEDEPPSLLHLGPAQQERSAQREHTLPALHTHFAAWLVFGEDTLNAGGESAVFVLGCKWASFLEAEKEPQLTKIAHWLK